MSIYDEDSRHWDADDFAEDPAETLKWRKEAGENMRSRGATFYHGTDRDVEGDTLLPGAKIGDSNWGGPNAEIGGQHVSRSVFQTTDENTAWGFANNDRGRPRVYEVEPQGELVEGVHTHLHEYLSDSSKIKDTHWGPPGSQPSLPIPGLDWTTLVDKKRGKANGDLGREIVNANYVDPNHFLNGGDDLAQTGAQKAINYKQFNLGDAYQANSNAVNDDYEQRMAGQGTLFDEHPASIVDSDRMKTVEEDGRVIRKSSFLKMNMED